MDVGETFGRSCTGGLENPFRFNLTDEIECFSRVCVCSKGGGMCVYVFAEAGGGEVARAAHA